MATYNQTNKAEKALKVYIASAGSGKTYTLVSKYLALCINSDDPEYCRHIYVTTFTNAATDDIKDKIFRRIDTYLDSTEKLLEFNLENDFGLNSNILYDRLYNIKLSLLFNPDFFNVYTIDRLLLEITKGNENALNLPIDAKLELDANALKDYLKVYFRREIKNSVEVQEYFKEYLTERVEEHLENPIQTINNLIDMLIKKMNSLPRYSRDEMNRIKNKIELNVNELGEEIAVKKVKAKEIFDKFIALATDNGIKFNKKELNYEPDNYDIADSFQYFKDESLYSFLFSDEFDIQNYKYFCKIRESKTKSERVLDLNEILGSLDYSELKEYLSLCFDYYKLKYIIKKNFVFFYINDFLLEGVEEYEKRSNTILLSRIGQKLSEYLNDNVLENLLANRSSIIRHLMIDEFQDTSEIQWKCLKPLLNNLVAEGQLCYIVADPKQSIYRWRDGKVEILLNEILTYGDINKFVEVKYLEYNYRSSKEIIDFNNHLFSNLDKFKIGNDNPDITSIYETASQKTKKKETGQIPKIKGDPSKTIKTEEKDIVLKIDILRAVRLVQNNPNFSADSFAIIARTAALIDVITEVLKEEGIPYFSTSKNFLENDVYSGLILALLSSVHHVSNDLGLGNEYYNYQAAHFINLINHKTSHDEFGRVWVKAYLSENEDLATYNGIEFISKLRQSILQQSNNEVDIVDNAYIELFIQLVSDHISLHGNNTGKFIREYEYLKHELKEANTKQGIELITVHSAKGLEWNHTIFVYNGQLKSPSMRVKMDEIIFINYDNIKLPFFNISENNLKIFHFETYQKLKYLNELEQLNILYVALTRPVKSTYIISYSGNNELYDAYKESLLIETIIA